MGQGAGTVPGRVLPRDRALLPSVPSVPSSVEIQGKGPPFFRHEGVGSEETLQPRLITVICTHGGRSTCLPAAARMC